MPKTASFLLLLLLAATAAFAGTSPTAPPPPFQLDEEGRVYFETLHEMAGVSASDLFTKAEKWLSESFKKDEIAERIADSNRGWLKFRTLMVTPAGWHGLDTSGDGFLRIEIQLGFKDGRARFRAGDFHFLVASTWSGDGKKRVAVTDAELFLKESKKAAKAHAAVAARLEELSKSFGAALAAGAESDF